MINSFFNLILSPLFFSINGNDTCTELILESCGPTIVNTVDNKGRYIFFSFLFHFIIS